MDKQEAIEALNVIIAWIRAHELSADNEECWTHAWWCAVDTKRAIIDTVEGE